MERPLSSWRSCRCPPAAVAPAPSLFDLAHQWMALPSGLSFKEQVLGTGARASVGRRVAVAYTGRLLNGVVFDSSKWHSGPIEFELGKGKGDSGLGGGHRGHAGGRAKDSAHPRTLGLWPK